jgi:tRNA pseudouridine synthase 10
MAMDPDEDDEQVEWVSYSSAGYGSAEEGLWEDVVPTDSPSEEIDWYDENPIEGESIIEWDAPPCPAPLGIAYLARIGCCDFCLHRLGGRRTDSTGAEGGAALRKEAEKRDPELANLESSIECPTCENLLDDVGNVSKIISSACDGIQFSTMQVGVHIPKDLIEEEDRIRSRYGAPGSKPLKAAFVEEVQTSTSEKVEGIEFVRERPDLMVLIDTLTLRVDVDVRPVFLYGRYRKLSREIPQTRWPCRACRGRDGGCESCESTGLQYPDSVQDLIGKPIAEQMDALDTAFHGMGREDIDVRCLGQGRPFVLEVKSPKKRTPQFDSLLKLVESNAKGRVEIDSLRLSDRKEVARIKQTRSEKSYTIRFKPESIEDPEKISEDIFALAGTMIEQQTPKRVSHRRADRNRVRQVVSVDRVDIVGDEIEMTLRCEAGTYIKELVHSDEGRTIPSVTSIIGAPCEVIWLDVEDVHAD